MNYEFDSTTFTILTSHGWSRDRRINMSMYTTYYKELGRSLPNVVKEFLKSFGKLRIELDIPDKILKSRILFDPPASNISLQTVKRYENWLNVLLYPAGLLENQALLMTEAGAMYSVFDDYVFLRGNTVEESVESICLRKPRKRIYNPDESQIK